MNKGLEALNILWESKQECSASCNSICLHCQKAKARDIIEKNLEILEIIKKKLGKEIKVDYSISGTRGKHYFIETPSNIIPITETEFNLIKEWLEK